MVTIKDIAEMAKVSKSTVSRVLNNSGYVSEDARMRVEKVVEQTNYTPSQHAKSLRTKKTKIVGVILPTIQTETSSKIVTGLGREFSKLGYEILLANTNLNKEKEFEYLDLLKVRGVDGIVLIATNTEPKLLEKIKEINIPLVMVGQAAEGMMSVTYDDYHASRELTSLLIDKGHERIAFIGVDETDQAVGMRKKGFLQEMAAHQLEVSETWLEKGIFDIDSGYDAMEKILSNSRRSPNKIPTALIAVTDRLAMGAMSYLKKQGMRVPEDMAIAGFGASEFAQYLDPPLTTVDYQNEKAGEEAAIQLINCMHSKNHTEKIVLDYRLIERTSI
ncbi:LacI family DNA-binding transcriptional regulator [Oceanobacillus chungangensis]|uniref:LacI family transcriptional regulator n=1 Tax=Oceanobacillus chungangensis TaxID=1229152 RepID=A0A3D8PXZ6_9BACI|nr:LacI family DNA-binding transcriptional regulator [Oceanobacillus chungangensis]RDW19765.1 LacI family transcriptional regulator [Oceanobacillus chungangensis]